MAGRRQHYLPRLLQRGFLDASAESERTWLHRCGGPAKLVGIADVGVSEYFYSRPVAGEVTLDDVITELEGDLGAVILGYRDAAPGEIVDAAVAGRTVLHLVTRTAHIRSVLTDAMTLAIDRLEQIFADNDRLSAMLNLASPTLSPLLIEGIREQALRMTPAGVPPAFSERVLAFVMREKGAAMLGALMGPVREAFAAFTADLSAKMREAHAGVLVQDPNEHAWIATLSAFDWRVEAFAGLILSDAVGLAREAESEFMPLMFTSADKAHAVVLPVSHDRVLVGLREGAAPVDLSELNRQSAACSDNFFVSVGSRDVEPLAALIGTGPANAIETMIGDAIANAGGGEAAALPRHTPIFSPSPAQFSYSVTLADFGDAEFAASMAEVLQGVVGMLARQLPLDQLDGFTLAVDYAAALAGLDRGGGLPPEESGALGYGAGIAKTVSVVRDGVPKVHIVIEAGIALSWLAEEADIRAGALNILVKMLAMAAHDRLYREDLETPFDPDIMTREFHLAVASAPRGWFSARESAFVAPDIGDAYAELVRVSLVHGLKAVAAERETFERSQEIAPLAITAVECASAILSHVADWLGHRDGLAEDAPFAGSDLPEQLIPWGLEDWIELYGRDLHAIYETGDGHLDIARATAMSPHVERILWRLGVLPWPEDGTIRWGLIDPGPVPTPPGAEQAEDDGTER